MPSFIVEAVAEPILEVVIPFVLYGVGRLVVTIVSLGQLKCDRLLQGTTRGRFKWSGIYRWSGRQLYLTSNATMVIGLLFCGLAVGLGLWLYLKG